MVAFWLLERGFPHSRRVLLCEPLAHFCSAHLSQVQVSRHYVAFGLLWSVVETGVGGLVSYTGSVI